MAISLSKGSQIKLNQTSGKKLENVCVGLNWGAIKGKALFGLMTTNKTVDLDSSAAIFDQNKKLIDTVYFKNLKSKDGAIKHSGDDLTGDASGDDNRDNEIITINFARIQKEAHTIVLFLNSYQKQDFSEIPYSKIRIFEGTLHRVQNVLASFNLSSEAAFAGHTSMIMGKFVRKEDDWQFEAIGQAEKTSKVFETVDIIQEKYI
jgi:tellurium resistance protein TerZ